LLLVVLTSVKEGRKGLRTGGSGNGHNSAYGRPDALEQANIALRCFYRKMTEPSAKGQGLDDRVLAFLETDNGQRITICAFSVLATLVLILFEGGTLAFVFGLPYMFFIPGFAVVRLFFWKGTSPEAKFVLSLGLSILVIIFLGLILVLTPIGLDSNTTRLSLIVFAVGAVAVETFVPKKAPKGADKDKVVAPAPEPRPKVDKVVAAMLATALVVSGISLGLILTADYPSRTYFAMTDGDGMVITNVTKPVNSSFAVMIHMKNGEDGPRNFTVVAYGVGEVGERDTQTVSRDMAEGETWNETFVFVLDTLGYFRLDFDLYIQEEGKPPYLYGNLHLWFGVYDASPTD